MVVMRYPGLVNANTQMERLKPAYSLVIEMMIRCRPFGEDYCALMEIQSALVKTALHFTGDETFFSRKPPVGNGC